MYNTCAEMSGTRGALYLMPSMYNKHSALHFRTRVPPFVSATMATNEGRFIMYDTKRRCSFEGCSDSIYKSGRCKRHYNFVRYEKRKSRKCNIEGCTLTHYSRGFCRKHHIATYNDKCEVEGCTENRKVGTLCAMHYNRMARLGEVGPAGRLQGKRGDGFITGNKKYKMILCPGHPNATKSNHVLEHIKIMSDILGRPLIKGETVHHKNGNGLDNRPENLELWVSNHPSGQKAEDLIKWAREIIERYGKIFK